MKVADTVQQLGKALPCSVVSVKGAIVKVKFEVQSDFTLPNVVVPHFGPEYIRYPTQPGDKGVVFPADAYLGGITGLGGGVANLTNRGNLSALVFFPVANSNWSAVDPNAVTIYGPNGVVLKDQQTRVSLTLTPNGIVINLGGGTLSIINGDVRVIRSSGGTGNLSVDGAVVAGFGTGDQVGLQSHSHSQGVDSRGDAEQNTNAPIPGT